MSFFYYSNIIYIYSDVVPIYSDIIFTYSNIISIYSDVVSIYTDFFPIYSHVFAFYSYIYSDIVSSIQMSCLSGRRYGWSWRTFSSRASRCRCAPTPSERQIVCPYPNWEANRVPLPQLRGNCEANRTFFKSTPSCSHKVAGEDQRMVRAALSYLTECVGFRKSTPPQNRQLFV